MGNYRFRLSDMIPNAWFYKLTDVSKTRKHNTTTSPKKKPPTSSFPPQRTHLSQTRYSYYITTDHQKPNRDERFCYNSPTHPRASDTTFPEQPRRSSTKRSRRKAVYKPSTKKHVISSSVSSGHCSCHASTPESLDYFGSSSSERTSTEAHDFHELIPSEFETGASEFGSYSCRVSSSTSDTIIDKRKEGSTNKVHDRFDMISELELPPIVTKPMKFADHTKAIESTKFRKSTTSTSKLKERKGHQSLSVKIVKEERSHCSRTQKDQKATAPFVRNSSASPTGIRLRGNSPRLASKKLQQQPCGSRKSVSKNRGGISDSFAVVKSSLDPQRDFKDSMKEMIMENNIKESKDLEDLLTCYLSLNSREYHDLIIKAFEQIWFDMARMKI